MAVLDAFSLYTDSCKKLYIMVRDKSITFSKTTVDILGRPAYVHMYFDKAGKQVAFQACEKDAAAIPFYKEPKEGRPVFVRMTDKKKAELLMEIANERANAAGNKYYGKYYDSEKVVIVHLDHKIVE